MAVPRSSSSPRSLAYLAGLALLRRGIAPTPAGRSRSAVAVQLVPLAAPLLLSTDAWTYWGYGWIGTEGGGNPYVDPPSDFPREPCRRLPRAPPGATRTTVYGPAFTLLSEPVALASGDSSDVAAWLFKALAAAAILVARRRGRARRSRDRRLPPPSSAGTPCSRVHVAGGGHNDALVGGLAALVGRARGPPPARARRRRAGRSRRLVKWIPLVFLALAALAARARGSATGARGIALVAALAVGALATWRYGLDWLRVVGPLADNAVLETSYALPSRLEQLGVPDGAAFALALTIAAASGCSFLARRALRGERTARPRRVPRPRDDPLPRGLVPRLGGPAGGGGRGSRRPDRRARAHGVPAPADDSALANAAQDEDPVLVEHRLEPPRRLDRARAPRRTPRAATAWSRIARSRPVDRDPLRLAEHREAEDPPALGEVRAERVRRAHRRVGRDRAERARRDLGVPRRRRARARRGRTRTGRGPRSGADRGGCPRSSVETTIARPSGSARPGVAPPETGRAEAPPRPSARESRRPCSGSGSRSACACPRGG